MNFRIISNSSEKRHLGTVVREMSLKFANNNSEERVNKLSSDEKPNRTFCARNFKNDNEKQFQIAENPFGVDLNQLINFQNDSEAKSSKSDLEIEMPNFNEPFFGPSENSGQRVFLKNLKRLCEKRKLKRIRKTIEKISFKDSKNLHDRSKKQIGKSRSILRSNSQKIASLDNASKKNSEKKMEFDFFNDSLDYSSRRSRTPKNINDRSPKKFTPLDFKMTEIGNNIENSLNSPIKKIIEFPSMAYDSPKRVAKQNKGPPKLKSRNYLGMVDSSYDLDWSFLKVNETLWNENLAEDPKCLPKIYENLFPKDPSIEKSPTINFSNQFEKFNPREAKWNCSINSNMQIKEKVTLKPQIWNFNTITTMNTIQGQKEISSWSLFNTNQINPNKNSLNLNLESPFLQNRNGIDFDEQENCHEIQKKKNSKEGDKEDGISRNHFLDAGSELSALI